MKNCNEATIICSINFQQSADNRLLSIRNNNVLKEIIVEQYDGKNRKIFWSDGGRSFLRYPLWYSANAEIEVEESTYYYNTYDIFGSSWKLYNRWQLLISTKVYSDNEVIFVINAENNFFRFVSYGLSSNLKDVHGKELVNIRSRFSWKELWTVTSVFCDEEFAETHNGKILLMLCLDHFHNRE